MARVVVMYGVAGVDVAVGRIRVGVDVGRGRVGVDVGRRRVGVDVGRDRGVSNLASSVATLSSRAPTSLRSALLLARDETLRVSVVIRPDKPSRVE